MELCNDFERGLRLGEQTTIEDVLDAVQETIQDVVGVPGVRNIFVFSQRSLS